MKIKSIVVEYAEKRSENFQSAEHRTAIEFVFDETDKIDTYARAIAAVAAQRETLVGDVTAQVKYDMERILAERNGPPPGANR